MLIDTANEKGISSLLTTDPSPHCGSMLNKSDFQDSICIRYAFLLNRLPTMCVCGTDMTLDHACTCPCGGYSAAQHDEIRDLIADVMHDALRDVEVEPQLLPVEDEELSGRTTNLRHV